MPWHVPLSDVVQISSFRGLDSHADHAEHEVTGGPWSAQNVSSELTAAAQSPQLAHVYDVPFETLYWIETHAPADVVAVHSW